MNNRLLLQELLGKCQSIREEIEIDLEYTADILKRQKRKNKCAVYIADAYSKLHELEQAIDKLAASALDFEMLFRKFYDEALFVEDDRNGQR